LSRVLEGCTKLVDDGLDHNLHVTLACHVKLLVVGLDVQIENEVRVCDHFLAMPILLRLVDSVCVLIL
jgi:hypothetical protein